jgi:hypothetical protein
MLTEASRFNVAVCGRQLGKTTLGTVVVAHAAADAHLPCAWFAPTYKYLDQVWRSLRDILEPVTVTKSEQQHRLDLRGGGSVDCWSLEDADAGRGRRYGLVVVDEAAMVRDLERVWQASLRPTLSVSAGKAWFLSTPKGLNYFHQLYRLGVDPHEAEWKGWQLPSSASPYIRPEEIAAAQRSLTERVFAQEYLAQFLETEGAGVFRGVRAVCRLQPQKPQPGHAYVMGVDWARTEDATAFCIVDASLGEQVALDRMIGTDYELQLERLHRWAELYRPRAIMAEANSMGGPLIERLQHGYARLLGSPRPALPVIPWTATVGTKAHAVQQLALAIENGTLTLLEDAVQMGELLAYEATVLPSGVTRYAAPEGSHDDTVTALMLANLAAAQEPMTRRSSYAFGTGGRP